QTVLGGRSADSCCQGRRDNRQISVLSEAALEVGFDANGSGPLVGGDGRRRRVVLWLVLGGNAGGLRRVVKEIGKELESQHGRRKGHGIAVRQRQRWTAVIEIGMKRSAAEVVQYLRFDRGQVNERGVAEVQVRTRELLVVVREHRGVGGVGIQVHFEWNPGN